MSSKYPILSETLTKRYSLTEADADKFITLMFDVLLKGVEQDGVVKVKGLGTFKLIPVGARESIDVNTGERIVIDGRNKITFVPDIALRDRVNSPFAQFETVVLNEGVDFSSIDENQDMEEDAIDDESIADYTIAADVNNDEKSPADNSLIPGEVNQSCQVSPTIETIQAEESFQTEESSLTDKDSNVNDDSSAKGCSSDVSTMNVVANKLTDASDKLSSASYKLYNASDRLSTASERLSDSSQHLSNVSNQASDLVDGKKLDDALAIVNDLRKRVFEMKEKSFAYTNENRKLKNANIRLEKRVRNLCAWIWGLVFIVVTLFAVMGTGWYLIDADDESVRIMQQGSIERQDNRLQIKSKQALSEQNTPEKRDTMALSEHKEVAMDVVNSTSVEGKPTALNGPVLSQDNKGKSVSNGKDKILKKTKTKKDAITEKKYKEKSVSDNDKRTVSKVVVTTQNTPYDADPRVRTGAYRIVGVAQMVVLRKRQTLSSISRPI